MSKQQNRKMLTTSPFKRREGVVNNAKSAWMFDFSTGSTPFSILPLKNEHGKFPRHPRHLYASTSKELGGMRWKDGFGQEDESMHTSSFCIELAELDGANWFIVWGIGMFVILEKRFNEWCWDVWLGVVKRKSRLEMRESEGSFCAIEVL